MKKKGEKQFFFFHLFVGQRKKFKHHEIQKTNKKNYDSTTSSTRIIFITKARRKDQIKNEVKSTDRDSKQNDLTLCSIIIPLQLATSSFYLFVCLFNVWSRYLYG